MKQTVAAAAVLLLAMILPGLSLAPPSCTLVDHARPLAEAGTPDSFLRASRRDVADQAAGAPQGVPLDVVIVMDYSSGGPAFPDHHSLWTSLATALGQQSHNITLLLSSVEGVDGIEAAASQAQISLPDAQIKAHTLPKHKIRVSAPGHVAVSYSVFLWLRDSARADLVYFTDWQGLGYYATVAKRQGLALHDTLLVTLLTGSRLWHGTQPGGASLSTTADLELAFMEQAATEGSDVVVATSASALNWHALRGWKLPEDVRLAGFWPLQRAGDLSAVTTGADSVRLLGGSTPPEAMQLVFLGDPTLKDGLPLFCSAISSMLKSVSASQLQPFTIAFAISNSQPLFRAKTGDREQDGRTYLEEQVAGWERLGGSDMPLKSVTLLEGLSLQQQLSYMAKAPQTSVAVIVSPAESGGFVMASLLHHGLPFLATNTTQAQELISPVDHEGVLVQPVARALGRRLSQLLLASTPLSASSLSGALQGASDAWSSWHSALSATKAQVVAQGAPSRTGPDSLFPPGAEVLAHSLHGDLFTEPASRADPGEQPLVTVVMATYNRGALLLHALESLRDQDYPAERLEVVLVDDGSETPAALFVLEELMQQGHWFTERGWQLIRSPGGYLGNARNRGIQAARGEWVLFMDDDNVAKPSEVSVFIQAAKATGAQVLTCFNDYLPDGTGAPGPDTVPSGRYVPLGPSPAASIFRNAIGDANAFFLRSVLEDLGGWAEDDAYAVQDWELLSAAVLKGYKVEVVPEALYWYRTNSGSMVRNKLYGATASLPLRSFVRWGHPDLAPAAAVAARQAEDATLLRQKVSQLEAASNSQGQLLRLMAKESCKGDSASDPVGNRIRDGELEKWDNKDMSSQWEPYEGAGYSGSLEGRPGAFQVPGQQAFHSAKVTLSNIGQAGGAMQHIHIGQSVARPLLFQGWSKVVEIIGGSGAPLDYSLYTDITYTDGTHRWAFHVPLDPEAEGWQHAWAVIDSPKPIHLITIVTMFRWYEGTVLFDDLMLTDIAEGMCHIPLGAAGDP